VGLALGIFGVQLALNFAWSLLFFGLHRLDLAMLDIVALWLSIFATIILFYRLSTLAALLLIPYLLWVTFASALNYALWHLNR
ncbi:MAG: TspO/MBR family protein, partial [Armatimonadia bacterium]